MTTQPDRQDGDELLRGAFKPFADYMDGPSFNKLPNSMPLTAGSPIARRQITVGDLRTLAAAITTPQLAPDAMEALRVISTMAVYEDGETDENLRCIIDACRDIASSAFSAPVPSPDGAGDLPPTKSRSTPSEVVGANHAGPVREEENRPLPPSATGAAEPVAWRWRNHVGDFDWSEWKPLEGLTPEQFKKQFENGFARGEFELRPLFATPPVRGDRETLHAIIEDGEALMTVSEEMVELGARAIHKLLWNAAGRDGGAWDVGDGDFQISDAAKERYRRDARIILTAALSDQAGGWRDISTAPDNHLPVQVYGPYGQLVAFRDVTWAWWPIPAVNPLGYKLTHWRPLPARPPASTSGEVKSG